MSARRRGSLTFVWYILFVAVLTLWVGVRQVSHPNGWTPGDWLINYEGGFVRRGLSGELILMASRALPISPLVLTLLLALLFYGTLYYAAARLYAQSSRQQWELVALLSPATLAFPILDATGSFRKEIIYLAVLGVLLLFLKRKPKHDVLLSIGLALGCVLALLCHEAILPYLVYVAGALFIGLRDPLRVLRVAALPFLGVTLTMYAILHHQGSVTGQAVICRSLGAVPPIVCSGAIAYLARGSEFAHAEVVQHIRADHYLFYFPLLTLLALLPLAYGFVCLARRRALRPDLVVLLCAIVAASACSVPLFVYALDWGRWIYIHVFSVFLLLLFIDVRDRLATGQVSSVMAREPHPALPQARWVTAALLMYATCWNLPHYGNYPKKGYWNEPLHELKRKLEQRAHEVPVRATTSLT